MSNLFFYTCIFLFASTLLTCVKGPNYPVEPHIEYLSIDKNVVDNYEVIKIKFSFKDGDGDLGGLYTENSTCSGVAVCEYESDSSCFNDHHWSFFAIDMRDSCFTYIRLPDVEPEGSIKGVSGEMEVSIIAVCTCLNNCTEQTTSYKLVVRDKAGHLSNFAYTEPVTINCN